MHDFDDHEFDLHAIDFPDHELAVEQLPEGNALGTFSTTSTASSASCPVSSAGSVLSANCQG